MYNINCLLLGNFDCELLSVLVLYVAPSPDCLTSGSFYDQRTNGWNCRLGKDPVIRKSHPKFDIIQLLVQGANAGCRCEKMALSG